LSSSSDREDSGEDGGGHVHRRAVARSPGREVEGTPHRRLPENIIPADDRYAVILDCASYALANTDVLDDRTMAHGLGRLRMDVSTTFGRDAEWDGTPDLGVFEFLNRFVEAGNHSESKRAEPSTSFRRSPRVTSNGSCTRSCRPKKEGGVERSVPTWNWSAGSSGNMRTRSL